MSDSPTKAFALTDGPDDVQPSTKDAKLEPQVSAGLNRRGSLMKYGYGPTASHLTHPGPARAFLASCVLNMAARKEGPRPASSEVVRV